MRQRTHFVQSSPLSVDSVSTWLNQVLYSKTELPMESPTDYRLMHQKQLFYVSGIIDWRLIEHPVEGLFYCVAQCVMSEVPYERNSM